MIDAGPLLQQFIAEARDLLEQAGRDLLMLERDPNDAEPMKALFRAVHTLKGTSGLFEILPLTQTVHAAEDLLDALQARELNLDATIADVLLEVLDQVGRWIDSLAASRELPADAALSSVAWVARLRAPLAATGAADIGPAKAGASGALPDWVAALAAADRQSCADSGPLFAVSYGPDANCFFRGEDPLALMRQIPGLRLLRTEAVAPWPGLDEIDPFQCNMRLQAIAAAEPAELEHLFRYVVEQVSIEKLPAGWPAVSAPADTETLRQVVLGQRRLLTAKGPPELWRRHLGSAVAALRGAVRYAGLDPSALEAAAAQAHAANDPAPLLGFIDKMSGSQASPEVRPGAALPKAADTQPGAPGALRIEPGKIDALMNLIGELVVAKNALAWLGRRAEDGSLGVRELAREIKDRQALVSRIAEEMQAAVMAVRMLPVDHVFQRFPRLVRDIARRLNKQVDLVVEGGDTEADKNVIEALADPLIHLVRNSLDHGIEPPEDRAAAGKPALGTIRLLALQDNDSVVIRIADDGRGIDPDVVRRKAVEKGLLDEDRAAALSDHEAAMLVFASGFSTMNAVSELSGRGVGMDVVRTAVEKAGGRVGLSTEKGVGTTVELTLPLSMAVTRIMIVACGERLFGIPMTMVVETVRVARGSLYRMRDREAFVLRDSVVPLVRLADLLDLPNDGEPPAEEAILVVRMNGERLGVVVGAFRDDMEVIVKPMDGVLAGLRGFAGTTLLGDGRVLLILDLRELVV